MFGFYQELTCPFCKKKYDTSYGITTFYKVNGEPHIEEYCPECKTEYYRPCGSRFIPDANTEGSIRKSEMRKEDLIVDGVACF